MSTTTGDPASPWRGREASGLPAPPRAVPPQADMPHALPITFHGSGSEYFRIWSVNLLLTLVSFGLYYPWAKARRLRYFYGNTFVGEHALDFHGDPKLMLRGFLVAALLAIAYSVAGKLSATAGAIALIVLAAVWPAMFWMSQRFRLANTSWRGLRFHFSGDLAGAYSAVLPFFVPTLLVGVVGWMAGRGGAGALLGASPLLLLPIAMLLVPFMMWRLKRYQHGHFNLGQVRTELRTGAGSFYGLALKLIGVAFSLPFIGGIVVALLLVMRVRLGQSLPGPTMGFALVFLVYALAYLVGMPYLISRSQNLVWGRTASPQLRFASELRYGPTFFLTLTNMLLIAVTLGLYAPFARVATARLRLQAVSVRSALHPDDLVASLQDDARRGVTGDAAGDFLGFDIGW